MKYSFLVLILAIVCLSVEAVRAAHLLSHEETQKFAAARRDFLANKLMRSSSGVVKRDAASDDDDDDSSSDDDDDEDSDCQFPSPNPCADDDDSDDDDEQLCDLRAASPSVQIEVNGGSTLPPSSTDPSSPGNLFAGTGNAATGFVYSVSTTNMISLGLKAFHRGVGNFAGQPVGNEFNVTGGANTDNGASNRGNWNFFYAADLSASPTREGPSYDGTLCAARAGCNTRLVLFIDFDPAVGSENSPSFPGTHTVAIELGGDYAATEAEVIAANEHYKIYQDSPQFNFLSADNTYIAVAGGAVNNHATTSISTGYEAIGDEYYIGFGAFDRTSGDILAYVDIKVHVIAIQAP